MHSGTGRTKLVADAMLGSLARKLRAFGLDTAYYRTGDDSGIVQLARSEGRMIITADRGLAALARSRGVAALLATGRTDGARISSLVDSARSAGLPIVRGPALCSLCGGSLEAISRADAASSVSPSILRRHRIFLRCMSCGHLYWRGSHWKKLRRLERAFDSGPLAGDS